MYPPKLYVIQFPREFPQIFWKKKLRVYTLLHISISSRRAPSPRTYPLTTTACGLASRRGSRASTWASSSTTRRCPTIMRVRRIHFFFFLPWLSRIMFPFCVYAITFALMPLFVYYFICVLLIRAHAVFFSQMLNCTDFLFLPKSVSTAPPRSLRVPALGG